MVVRVRVAIVQGRVFQVEYAAKAVDNSGYNYTHTHTHARAHSLSHTSTHTQCATFLFDSLPSACSLDLEREQRHIHTHTHMHTHIHTHTYTHTHTFTHAHTHTQIVHPSCTLAHTHLLALSLPSLSACVVVHHYTSPYCCCLFATFGSTAIALRGKDGVVFAIEYTVQSKLLEKEP